MITKTDQKTMRILGGVTDSWGSCHEIIRRSYPKMPVGRDPAEETFLMCLFNLADEGLIERQKRVVDGERGGEVVYVFRRAQGAEFKPKKVLKKMDMDEARDKILREFFRWKDWLTVEFIAKETGLDASLCRRILGEFTASGVVLRQKNGDFPAVYISAASQQYFLRGSF